MGVFVVAMENRYGCYYKFRMVDSRTGQVKDLLASEVFRYMTRGQNKFVVEHMSINYSKDTFKFKGYDDSRVCILNSNGEPIINKDGMIVTGVEGDYVYLANYTGQIIKAHMLQVGTAVKKRQAVLVNAVIHQNGRITVKESK